MITLKKEDRIFLVILFFISFFIRSIVFSCYLGNNNNYWQVDSATYDTVATSIAQGTGVSLADGQPQFYRLPGYPIFLAFFYKLFGHNHKIALWAQVVLGSCIPILIFFLSLALFPNRRWLARCASLYSTLHLGLVLYSGFFMTETVFIFLFLLFFICFTKAFSHQVFSSKKPGEVYQPDNLWLFLPEPILSAPSFDQFYERIDSGTKICVSTQGDSTLKNLFLAGLFLGLASLVRPVGHYCVALSLLVLFFGHDEMRQKLGKAALFFLAWLLPVSFWLLRNLLLTGHLFFHTLPGGHFLYLSAARVVAQADNISYPEARKKLYKQVHDVISERERELGRPLQEIEACYVHEKIAKSYFITHPIISVKLWLTDIFRTCLSLYSAELLYIDSGRKEIDYFAQSRSWWSIFQRYLVPHTDNNFLKVMVYLEIFLFLIILLGFFTGLIFLFLGLLPSPDTYSWLMALPFMLLFLVISLAGGYARMRLPIEPFLIVFSLYGWSLIVKKCRT